MMAVPCHQPFLRQTRHVFATFVMAALLSACSLQGALNGLIPTDGLRKQTDIPYGLTANDPSRRKLDLYQPTTPAPAGGRPVVVFFYGGSWDSGRKEDYLFVAEALTSQGWIVVLPDYRVYPEVLFPDFVTDAAHALRWTRHHIAQHGGNPQRIFVMGHSAGAHIAAMLTYDAQYLGKVGLHPRELAGFIGLAGPYDFLPLKNERFKIIFGPESERPRSQPINFVTGDAPPALLLHGDADTIVGPHNSANLARRIHERGGRVQHVRYPGLGHREIVVNLSAPFRGGKPELPDIAAFIRDVSAAERTSDAVQLRRTSE